MKSLNDLIWDKDSDLEEGKKDAVIKSRMNETCIVNSCGATLSPECYYPKSYHPTAICWE